tara:strand:+ start:145 stop:513 length:369 start_codon:yes stop_codon:yes gene_type:complete
METVRHWIVTQLIKRITKWNGTKRIQGTTQQEDENIFIKELNDEFVIFRREHVKEFLFKDGYKVYLVNVEQIEEDAKLDAWADRKEQEQIQLNDSLNISLDEKNDRVIRIKEHMKQYDKEDN